MTEDEMMDGISNTMDMSLSRLQELLMNREVWHAACSPWGHNKSDTTELSEPTERLTEHSVYF